MPKFDDEITQRDIADFVERLADLDRFIVSANLTSDPRAHFDLFSEPIALAVIAIDEDMIDETSQGDFVERLSDLDRFTVVPA